MDTKAMDISLNLNSPQDIASGIANRAKQRRLGANLTQLGLAARAQVSLGTLKQFERTGKSSIEFLIAIAFALGAEQEFESLFPPRPRKSIEDVISKPLRVRGRRK
jgi:transcriptional regulator with XRE-family HTH domain